MTQRDAVARNGASAHQRREPRITDMSIPQNALNPDRRGQSADMFERRIGGIRALRTEGSNAPYTFEPCRLSRPNRQVKSILKVKGGPLEHYLRHIFSFSMVQRRQLGDTIHHPLSRLPGRNPASQSAPDNISSLAHSQCCIATAFCMSTGE